MSPFPALVPGSRGGRVSGRPFAVLVALLLGALVPDLAHAQGAPSVTVAKPVVKNITEWSEFIGRFEAVDGVDLKARVGGYLAKVHFEDGALVKAGDLLFTIDQRTYKAALQEAEAAVTAAKARQSFADTDLQRAANLRRTDNISQQIYDQRKQTVDTNKAEFDRADAALTRAQLDLEFTEIRAPISGRVSRRMVSVGSLITANDTTLVNIVSLDPIQFYFDVDERSFLSFLGGSTKRAAENGKPEAVTVTLTDESDKPLSGHIDFIDNRLDPASGTMRGRAVFPNKDLALVPGLFGRIRLPASKPYDAVLVPDEALIADQDRRLVYVVGEDNKVSTRPVQLGPRADGYRIVRGGLTGEERIVVNGLSRVQPGVQIQPKVTELAPVRQAASN
ncbi:efflux RND transporter periplasmic adaptor subunit [Ancylobacter terrae]|uniref:efflux RND transporter periplasmic adaptor subunit n=1 Tax=Ancylobacter sp. sgz301288 TaxID=3342077 RepID=UPI00385F5C18